jgi:branched-chain amino acid transport system ATP-binding protein
LLRIEKVEVFYDKLRVIRGVNLHVDDGEIIALVGANGAGKSTFLRMISGLKRPSSGTVWFYENRIDMTPPHQIVEMGVIHVPEGRKIFPSLDVLENLYLGSYTAKAKEKRNQTLSEVFCLFPVLEERKKQLAGTLSGGEQQMLAIARGLMAIPRILMLDEPSLGLAPLLVREMFKVVSEINLRGTSILLVEQNVYHSLQISNRGYVLENGSIVLEGKSKELLVDENVKKAYLGM